MLDKIAKLGKLKEQPHFFHSYILTSTTTPDVSQEHPNNYPAGK